jgi:hypothetical protein
LKRYCAIARTGSPWRDLPAAFGHWNNVFTRFRHTNVLMSIGTDFCLIGLDTIRDSARRAELAGRLAGTGRVVIDLNHEQIGEFAGNVIELQGRFVAMSARALPATTGRDAGRIRDHPADRGADHRASGGIVCSPGSTWPPAILR